MKQTQNITIRVADVAPMSMTIKPDTEEIVRKAERNVNNLWSTWRGQFSKKSSKEVLAMVAYQFAKHYYELLDHIDAEQAVVAEFEAELDRLLQIVNPAEEARPTPDEPQGNDNGAPSLFED